MEDMPITVGRHEFVNWKSVRSSRYGKPMIQLTVDDDWASIFMGQLGQKVPGRLEDVLLATFHVYAVQRVKEGEALVLLQPEVAPSEEYL